MKSRTTKMNYVSPRIIRKRQLRRRQLRKHRPNQRLSRKPNRVQTMSIQVSFKISLFDVHVNYFQDQSLVWMESNDWSSWTSSSNENPSNWDLPDASDFNREPDMDKYKPPKVPDISQAIQNNPTIQGNRPIKGWKNHEIRKFALILFLQSCQFLMRCNPNQ